MFELFYNKKYNGSELKWKVFEMKLGDWVF